MEDTSQVFDWRTQDNRINGFLKYLEFGVKTWDVDPSTPLWRYFMEKNDISTEERYWLCFLYRTTYSQAGTWYIFKHWPWKDFDPEKFRTWFYEHFKNMVFSHDRWRAKHLTPNAVDKYVEMVKGFGGSQEEMFKQLTPHNDPVENFPEFWKTLLSIPTFGGVTNFNYCETLHRVMDVNIDTPSMFFKTFHWKPRKGMTYVSYGHFDDVDPNTLEENALDLHKLVKERLYGTLGDTVKSYLLIGRVLCLYAGVALGNRYPGYYWDRQHEELKKIQKIEPDLVQPILDFRRGYVPDYLNADRGNWDDRRKDLLEVFKNTGRLVNIDYQPSQYFIESNIVGEGE